MKIRRTRLTKSEQAELGEKINIDERVKRRYNTLEEEAKAIHTAATVSQIDYSQDSDSMKIAVCLVSALDIVIARNQTNGESRLFVWSPESGYHVDFNLRVNDLVLTAMQIIKSKQDLLRLGSLVTMIASSNVRPFSVEVDNFRERPRGMILLKDGAFDCQKDEYLENHEARLYHFTYKMNLKRRKKADTLHVKILERVFEDWSDRNDDKRQLLLDYLRCVLEGDNKGKALAIYGQGGNGKSAYITLAARILMPQSVMRLNIHDAENGFMLEDLSSETVLIAGDELRSNYLFGGESMARYKQIIDNQPIKINPKGRSPHTVLSHACIIQSMNTPMRFAEANDANKDRWIYIIWGSKNFRRALDKGEIEFDLDTLLDDEDFINSVFNFILDNTEYFKRIHVPESVSDDSRELIDGSDNVKLFAEDMVICNVIGKDALLTRAVLYTSFVRWLKDESPSAKPMSQRSFASRIKDILFEHGYVESYELENQSLNIRVSSINMLQWDRLNMFHATGIDFTNSEVLRSLKTSRYFFNSELLPKQSLIDSVRAELEDGKDIDLSNMSKIRVLKYIAYDEHNTLALSRYKQILDDL